MTGYGHGVGSLDGLKITVEISSINRKQSEVVVSLPRELEPLDSRIRDTINAQVSRGRLSVRISVAAASGRSPAKVRFNTTLARQYMEAVRRLKDDLRLDSSLGLDTLLRIPGIVELVSPLADPEQIWTALGPALNKAVRSLLKMRRIEGTALKRDLKQRLRTITAATDMISALAPKATIRYRDSLYQRLAAGGLDLPLDDERLLKEIALFADRSDISEELTRLRSHIGQFNELLKSTQPVGRTLDFLLQEMNREVNTIGSKANDASIASQVIGIKAELERVREQAQNIE